MLANREVIYFLGTLNETLAASFWTKVWEPLIVNFHGVEVGISLMQRSMELLRKELRALPLETLRWPWCLRPT
jgi:hypothetical protein